MLVRMVCQVDLSLGSMPRRVQTFLVISAACSLVKAWGILNGLISWLHGIGKVGCGMVRAHLTQPWWRKCSFSSGVRTGCAAILLLSLNKLNGQMLKIYISVQIIDN